MTQTTICPLDEVIPLINTLSLAMFARTRLRLWNSESETAAGCRGALRLRHSPRLTER